MTSNKFCSQPPASIRTSASNITATKVFWLVLTWDCLILNHWHLGTRTERKGSTIFLDIWQVWWKCSMACDPPRQFGEVAWQKFGMFVETKSEVCCLWDPWWPSLPRPSPWQSGSPESSQFMDVKFPGRFNAQNHWIQHMALTLNISSIITMKMLCYCWMESRQQIFRLQPTVLSDGDTRRAAGLGEKPVGSQSHRQGVIHFSTSRIPEPEMMGKEWGVSNTFIILQWRFYQYTLLWSCT